MKGFKSEDKNRLKTLLARNLSQDRYLHILSTMATSVELAKIHGLDEERAEIAALAHDVFRELKAWQLLKLAKFYDYKPLDVEQNSPVLLHGPMAAYYLKEKWQVLDSEVLQAVEFHTTGCPGLKPLGQVLFIADAVEPRRDYELREYFWQQAKMNLDLACLLILQDQKYYFAQEGRELHPLSQLWLQKLQENQSA